MKIYRSPHADILADQLARVLQTPVGVPFDPDVVVVSGTAAERLVRMQIAEQNGVCANVDCISPTTLLERTVTQLTNVSLQDLDAWHAEHLTWTVLSTLPEVLDDESFASVAHYLGDRTDLGSVRAIGLAERIASVFSRYVIVRPEMVCAWDAGRNQDVDATTAWQPILWRAMQKRIPVRHLAALAAEAIQKIVTEPATTFPNVPRLCWLTHPSVAKLYRNLLPVLARVGVDIHLFVITPLHAMPNTGVTSRAPLLQSLGRQALEFEQVLEAHHVPALEHIDLAEVPAPDSLLHVLQYDILTGVTRSGDGVSPVTLTPGDRSVQIHACHGPMRQTEVLHDQLLRLFDEHPDLEPRDVLVLTPSIAQFAPLIDAVFNGTEHETGESIVASTPSIPYRIHDRSPRSDNPAADVLLHLLELAGARADAASVLDYLSLPAVAARFGLDDRARDLMRQWVQESGIRWGIDEGHRAQHGFPPEAHHTWRFGLDRLLIGHAVPTDGRHLVLDVLPYDEIEGSDSEILGRFGAACTWIFDTVQQLQDARSAAAWCDVFTGILAFVFSQDDASGWLVQRVERVVHDLSAGAHLAGHRALVTRAAIKQLLVARLERVRKGGGSMAGVTFAALQAGRVIPARVIVLLGMDAEIFPRPTRKIGFDVTAHHPQPGDLDAGTDDRARFLEALMAARQYFLVCYTGRTLHRNEVVQPTVPVAELLDVIEVTCGSHQGIVYEHSMQPFSPANFGGNGMSAAPVSYDHLFLHGARAQQSVRTRPPAFLSAPLILSDTDHVVSVDDLAKFFRNPCRSLVEQQLRVRLRAGEDELEAYEPVVLDRLGEYQVVDALLSARLHGDSGDLLPIFKAGGRLPHGVFSELAYREATATSDDIVERWRAMCQGEPCTPLRLELKAGTLILRGQMASVWTTPDGAMVQMLHRAGTLRESYIIDAWIRHLATQVAAERTGHALERTVFLGSRSAEKSKLASLIQWRLVEHAEQVLEALLALYEQGRQAALPFFPATSHAYVTASAKCTGGDWEKHAEGLKSASGKWRPSYGDHAAFADGNEVYALRLYGHWHPGSHGEIDTAFAQIARDIWIPCLAHMIVEGTA